MTSRIAIVASRYGKSDRPCNSVICSLVFFFALILISVLVVASPQVWAQGGAVSGEAGFEYTENTAVEEDVDATQGDELAESEGQGELKSGDRFTALSLQEAYNIKSKVSQPEIDPRNMDSLFFTLWQYSLLQEAKRGFLTRPPTAAEMRDDGTAPRKRGVRELSLGGIVYNSADHWTIWLNGQRVGPDALPDSVIDIDVNREYVQLKWFDSYTNLIFPLRLRPHERFNLDTRIFLPGDGNKLN